MIFGTTEGGTWSETLPTAHGTPFTGRTFCRCHMSGDRETVPSICEIWATSEHEVEGHAHDCDELLYVLRGAIEVNGRTLRVNEVVFIPRGTSYTARVLSGDGGHVLRMEFPNAAARMHGAEYEPRTWSGPLTEAGFPDLGKELDHRDPPVPSTSDA